MNQHRIRPPDPPRNRVKPVDYLIVGAVVAAVVFVAYRVDTVLVYDWSWREIFTFMVRWDEETGRYVPNIILKGLMMTLRLAFWATIAAAIIGLFMGLCRTGPSLFLRSVARLYVELIRNIPPIVFIFVFYFFISSQIMPVLGIDDFMRDPAPELVPIVETLFSPIKLLDNFISGVIVLALFEGAYITEIVRAGVQSIGKGQWEAARAVGLSRFNVSRDIILPQALRNILPPLAGQFILLVKDSSIVALISIQELTFATIQVANTSLRFFESWIVTAFLYFFVCFSLAILFSRLEKKLRKSGWH